MSFVHLHLHTQYSLLDGALHIDQLFRRAKEYSMPAVAMTEHGNMFGAIEFFNAGNRAGVKPIIGCEVYLVPEKRKSRNPKDFPHGSFHMVLLARNLEGYRNLLKLVSSGFLEGFYYKPRIDHEILAEHSKGLIALSGCLKSPVNQAIAQGNLKQARDFIAHYRDLFEDDSFYIELQRNGATDQEKHNEILLEIAKDLSLPPVATNDVHYLDREHSRAHEILLCIQTGKTINDPNRMKYASDQFYFKSPEEMREQFSDVPQAVENTLAIAERCNLDIPLGKYHFPKYDLPKGKTYDDHLTELARNGLKERLPEIALQRKQPDSEFLEEYENRLEEELKIIRSVGFSGYFLIVADFINYAKKKGIPVGPGRGSAAGSIVAYATRITDIDPIPYKLLFERFLNPERISMPDIDVDFCIHGRDEVIQYVSEKYGGNTESPLETKVSQIITFGKMLARAVIRDVGRGLDIPYGEVDKIAKMVPEVLNIKLKQAFRQEKRFKELRQKDPRIDELLTIAQQLEGLNRHASTHAAGVVISDEYPLVHHLPLSRGTNGETITQYDMKAVEKIGLIKFDFLGLRTLTVLSKAIELIRQTRGEEIDIQRIPLDDKEVFDLLSSGETGGIFQLEGSGMRDLIVRLKPSSFEDIIALVALYRPGPLGSGMVDDFIDRKHGRRQVTYDLPQLEAILKDTYGVILYQEQVMQIASALANYSLGEADLLRRAMGKKIASQMESQRERFMKGAKAAKIDEKKAAHIFELMYQFAGYGFNKSHSAAYALISYQTAYLKTHFPREFMAAMMTSEMSNTDKIIKYINACREMKIEVLAPNINRCHEEFKVKDEKILFGLLAVKNIGAAAIGAIVETREKDGPFIDVLDLVERVDSRKINRRVIEALIKCGACDELPHKRSQMFSAIEKVMEQGQKRQAELESGQISIFDGQGDQAGQRGQGIFTEMAEWDEKTRLAYEKESTGFYISGHPLDKYADQIPNICDTDTANVMERRDGSEIRIAGNVAAMKEITTKRGRRMAFVTLEDGKGQIEMVVFSDIYEKALELLKQDEPIFVLGKVDVGEDSAKLLPSEIKKLTQALEEGPKSFHIYAHREMISEKSLKELGETLAKYGPGNLQTTLHLKVKAETEVVFDLPQRVAYSGELPRAVDNVLGSVRCTRFL